MRRIMMLAALLIFASLALQCAPACAQMIPIYVSAPSDVFVEVNGVKMYGRAFNAPAGSNVTILDEVVYESGDVRFRFAFWLRDGAFLTESPQIRLEAGGAYVAVYVKEFRVTVASEPLLFAETFWIPHSSRLNYTAPLEVQANGTLYRFRTWCGDAIIAINNTISAVVTGPMLLKARYEELYPLYVVRPEGSVLVGYFPSGFLYLYKDAGSVDGGVKRVLEDVVVVGGAKVKVDESTFIIVVQGKTIIVPVYATFYRVSVETIQGAFTEWVREGEMYTLTAPQTVALGTVTYAFSGWFGGVNASTPTYTLRVEGPVDARALYKKMYKVTVVSPRGERAIYVEEGKPLIIYEPPEYKGLLTSRVLKAFYVNDVPYQPRQPGILKVEDVREAMTVIAAYEEQVAWMNIALIALIPAAIIAAYAAYTSYEKRRKISEKTSS